MTGDGTRIPHTRSISCWVASRVPAGSLMRVLKGDHHGTLCSNDPALVHRDSTYAKSFAQSIEAMETLGAPELDSLAPVYVAYLREGR